MSLPATLNPEEAYTLAKANKLTLVDIRMPGEWARTGLPEGALALTASGPEFIDALLVALANDKSRPVALICASGNRSGMAQRALQANGFTAVANVVEGMTGSFTSLGWLRRALPVVPYKG